MVRAGKIKIGTYKIFNIQKPDYAYIELFDYPESAKFVKTGRNARCKCCNKIIPGDTLKLQVAKLKTYGDRRYFNKEGYCLKCAGKILKLQIRGD